MATGVITAIREDKGYGFIRPDRTGDDLFFHLSALKGLEWDQRLVEMRVSYDVAEDPVRDKKQAVNVRAR